MCEPQKIFSINFKKIYNLKCVTDIQTNIAGLLLFLHKFFYD